MPRTPSPQLLSIPSSRSTDIDLALLHTALWTRPPRYIGCDLSDCWAWLRYQRAFDTKSNLQLREEWDDIDPHQKTVLSDEMGVGFTTQLFAEELNFLFYVDTNYVIKRFQSRFFTLRKSRKRGPSKSPDYIALDNSLRFNILECKGTQTSQAELDNALRRGVSQKKNLDAARGTRVNESLVAGLFVPTWNSKFNATIKVCDPSWEDLVNFLEQMPFNDLLIETTKIALAKHFGLMGLHSIANALLASRTSRGGADDIPELDREELNYYFKQGGDHLSFDIEYPLPPQENHSQEIHLKARRIRFRMQCPIYLYEELTSTRSISETLYNIAIHLRGGKWSHSRSETTVQLASPLGFQLMLEYLY